MCPVKTQISLGNRSVWLESSLFVQKVAKDPSFLHADSENWSDWADTQADLSLRWVHSHFVGFVMWWLMSSNLSQIVYTMLALAKESFLDVQKVKYAHLVSLSHWHLDIQLS